VRPQGRARAGRPDAHRGRSAAAKPGGGHTLVIPVFEDVAVVVKRLILREEVRLRFLPTEQPFEETVEVRRQRAAVERVPPAAERDTR